MPCRDDRQTYVVYDPQEQQYLIDKLTKLLCKACLLLQDVAESTNSKLICDELEDWWRNHKIIDVKRQLEEKERKEYKRLKAKYG